MDDNFTPDEGGQDYEPEVDSREYDEGKRAEETEKGSYSGQDRTRRNTSTHDGRVATDEQPTSADRAKSGTNPEKIKVQINGQEKIVPIKDLVDNYQKSQAATQRFQEAAQIRDQVNNFIGSMEKGDASALIKVLGEDTAQKLAEKILLDKIKYESLSDEQREVMRLQQENQHYRTEAETRQKQYEEQQRNLQRNAAIKHIDTNFQQLFQKAGFKPTPRIVARLAEVQLAHLNSRGSLLDNDKAWQLVQRDLHSELGDYLGAMDYKSLSQVLPKKLLDSIRRGQVAEIEESDPFRDDSRNKQKPQTQSKKHKRRMQTDDWFAAMEKRFEGR